MVDRSYYFTEDEMKEMTRNEAPDDLKNYANEKWNIFKELNEEELKTNFKKSFEDYKPLLVKLFNNLYIEGYASVEEFNHFKNELDNVKNYDVGRYCLDGDENNCRLWAFTSTKAYENLLPVVQAYVDSVASSPKQKVGLNQNASASQCQDNLVKNIIQLGEDKNCKKPMSKCTSHSECCSSVCLFNDKGGGTCSRAFTCYKEATKGAECSAAMPHCEGDLKCTRIDYSSDIGDCRENGFSCESNDDCCSDKCVNNKCEIKFQCLKCLNLGDTPKDGEECCPGLYKSLKGKCIKATPPLPSFTFKIDNILKNIINFIIPSAHASECEDIGEDGLTTDQREKFQECLSNYNKAASTEAEEREEMVKVCYQTQRNDLEKNRKCLAENGTVGNGLELSKSQFSDYYNLSTIDKSFSDPKKCIFNTFNDSWKDRTHLERNSELVVRAFEAVYSGKGDDLIIDSKGQSIFKRASKISKLMRDNRADQIKRYQEIDMEMTCMCANIFGLDNLSPEQQTFYKGQCSHIEEKLGSEEEIDAVGIKHESMLVTWLEMRRDALVADFEANQKLEEEFGFLAEFIRNYNWYAHPEVKLNIVPLYRFNIRREIGWIQVVKFFLQLGHFITTAINEFFISLFNGDDEDYETTNYMVSFFNHKASTSPSNMDVVIANKDNKDIYAKNDCWDQLCIYVYDIYERQYHHPTFDNKDVSPRVPSENHCFVNGNPNQCIKGVYLESYQFKNPASEVLLEFKKAPLLDLTMPATVEEESYLVEKVLPEGQTFTELLNAQYQVGVEALKNTAGALFDEKKIMNNKWCSQKHAQPIDNFSCEGKEHTTHERCYNPKVRRPCMGERYVNKDEWDTGKSQAELYSAFGQPEGSGTSGQDQAHVMKEALKAFMPKVNGQLWFPETFGADRSKKFKEGIQLYSKCRNMLDEKCVKHSQNNFTSQHLGFGHLFEQEEDIKMFSDYVYEYHFLLPNFSTDSLLTYPKAAQSVYFDAVHEAIRLIGSLGLNRLNDIYGQYTLYKSSLDKRMRDYEGLKNAAVGTGSKNVSYSNSFFKAFTGLNFDSSVTMSEYNTKFDETVKGDSFTESELSALNSMKKHVMSRMIKKQREEHFEKVVGKTKRGKNKKLAVKGIANTLLNPLSRMPMQVGGQNFGKGGALSSSSNLFETNEKLGGSNIKKFEQFKSSGISSISSFSPKSFDSSSSTPSTFSSTSSTSDGNSSNSDISNREIETMLIDVENNKESYMSKESDSLFTKVTKAYNRNLTLILKKKDSTTKSENPLIERKKIDISKDKKEELKDLLNN